MARLTKGNSDKDVNAKLYGKGRDRNFEKKARCVKFVIELAGDNDRGGTNISKHVLVERSRLAWERGDRARSQEFSSGLRRQIIRVSAKRRRPHHVRNPVYLQGKKGRVQDGRSTNKSAKSQLGNGAGEEQCS